MEPNTFIKKLKEYPLVSHRAWESSGIDAVLKLDWNEANIELPAVIKDALKEFIDDGRTSWYPDMATKILLEELSRYTGAPKESIQYFEGSDCALDYVVRTFAEPGERVAIAAPTYDNFRVYVESAGAVPDQILNDDIFAPNIRAFVEKVQPDTKLVYLVNPNNPTGIIYSLEDIEYLATALPNTLIFIDEAYAEFSGATAIPLTQKHSNILVSRSFSKSFALASFRIGYVVSAPENIVHLNKVRNGKNIPTLSQIAAIKALQNRGYMEAYVEETRCASAYVCEELHGLGFSVRSAPTNWILLHVPSSSAFRAALEKEQVYVRDLSHLPGMENYIRITIGSMDVARKLVEAIKRVRDVLA